MMNPMHNQPNINNPERTAQEDTSPLLESSRPTADFLTATDSTVIPIIAEQLEVTKQVVESGKVRLMKTVEEHPETVRTALIQEEFDVERIPMDQYVTETPALRIEGDTMIYPVLREVVVVEKRLLLVEEIRVTKRQIETIDEQTINLRREVVTVERSSPTDERSV